MSVLRNSGKPLPALAKFSDDQERDDSGKWTSGGGGSPATEGGISLATGTQLKTTEKFNARSTDPITGVQTTKDSFALVKRGTIGTVVAVLGPDDPIYHPGQEKPEKAGEPTAVITYPGITSGQAVRVSFIDRAYKEVK
jgi:hypothetical protein